MSTPTTRIDVISLLSSSSGTPEPNRKRFRPATPEVDTVAPSNSTSDHRLAPVIEALLSKFVDKSALREHLGGLSKDQLKTIILDAAYPQPEPAEGVLHCVYCHEAYDPKTDNYDCSIEHYGELDDDRGADTKSYDCCGKSIDYYGYDEDYMQSPRDKEENRYCWQGKHNARELREGDPDADEGTWWEGWHGSGRTCEDMGCKPIESMVKDGETAGKRVKV